jgi:hypothetical protein
VSLLTRMLHAIDARDWAAVRASFADEVHTDYTSLWGGSPATQPVDELVSGWRDFAGGFAATQHLTGPVIEVDGEWHAHVQAHHWRDGQAWSVYGHYIARTTDDKITSLTLRMLQEVGRRP